MVKIGGLRKVSLIDFPGKIAAVVFTQGCNFRCQFCHNPSLVLPQNYGQTIGEDGFFEFLEGRVGKIDGVVLSGGEPTLHADLGEFIGKIKGLGFMAKLDTNGTNPAMLNALCADGLLDYVAMDIKHRFEDYDEICGTAVAIENVRRSVKLLMDGSVPYEFRTTVVPAFHDAATVKAIAVQLAGAKGFHLQEFVADHAINGNLSGDNSLFSPTREAELEDVVNFCRAVVEDFSLRRAT